MLSTNLIVDEFARNGRVGLFWKKIAPSFLKQLAPAQVSQTHSKNAVAPLVEEAVKNGYKKIVLIGDQSSIFEGINALMRFPADLRKHLSVGLWLLHDWDMLLYSVEMTRKLETLARIFKAGHTCPMDLGKVELTRGDQTSKTLYYWKQCEFSYVEDPCLDTNLRPPSSSSFFTQFIPFHILAKAHLQTEYQSFYGQGGLNVRIVLHDYAPHSLNIAPDDVKQTKKFMLLWQRGINYGGQWVRFPWMTFQMKNEGFGKTEQKNCLIIKVQGVDDPLSLRLDGQDHLCTNANFEIIREALPIIIKMAPIRSKAPAKQILSTVKSGRAVANRQPLKKIDH